MARYLLIKRVIRHIYGGAMRKVRFLIGVFIGLLGVALLFSAGETATAPEVAKLLTIGSSPFPGGIATDNSGNIYLGDTINKQVRIYNHRGVLIDAINLDFKPVTLAVSPSGYLYVGGKKRIDLYSGKALINSYKDIVNTPASIAFLNGKTYVADGYFVKVFDSNMNKITEFGGYAGNDNVQRNGKFTGLRSIAVDLQNSQIYCLDSGAIAIENGYTTYVWRVQVFDENGNFIRSFSKYGFGVEGKVGAASSIAVDNESRVYVADSNQNIIVVYDSYGAYLKTIYDNNAPYFNPVQITFNNNRLYIASSLAKSIYVLAIDNYAFLRVEPLSLEFSSYAGANLSGQLTIFNDGKGDLSFNAESSVQWMALSTTSGVVAPGGSIPVNLLINTSGLSLGTYTGSIDISSNGGSEKVQVTLHILPPPTLDVSPQVFDLVKKKGSPVDPLIVNISLLNDPTNSMTWSASSDSPWLTITPTTGSSNSTVSANILVNTNLEPGTYTGHITVTADGANGSPATITVNLEIKTSRRIAVSTNLESASFTITGPASYEGSGTTYVIEDAPAGTYTVTFKHVKGYRTPKPQTGTLSDTGEVTFNGEYIPVPQGFHILASHGPGNKDDMEIRVYDIDGNLLITIPPVKPYRHGATVQTGDINGDGINEIIIGTGPDTKAPSKVFVLDTEGNLLGQFSPFDRYGYGIEISLSDLDNDGALEIITAKTRKFAGTPLVDLKAFKYKDGQFIATGLRLRHRGANGIRISSADLNNDGIPEVLVVPARGDAPVYVYHIDTTSTPWTGELIATHEGCNGTGGANIATGDTDGDGTQEILLACQYDTGTVVRILNNEGSLVSEFPTGSTLKDYIASGDLDEDGIAEIIIGDGPSAHKRSIKIFNPQGELLKGFDAFEDSFGVRVSTGRLQ
jgi:hypothetical protein